MATNGKAPSRKSRGAEREGSRAGRKRAVAGKGKEPSYREWLDELREGVMVAQADPLRIVYANPAMTVISGYSVRELLALSPEEITSLVHPEDRGPVFERLQQRLEGEFPPEHNEFRGVRKNGEVIWLTLHATRIEFEGSPASLGTITNITDLKAAERAARESEAKLKAQYRAIPVPTHTWRKQGEDFILIDFNDAAEKMTKGEISRFLGITAREMYHDATDIVSEMERCYREQLPIEREMEYRLRTTGELKYLSVKYSNAPPDLVLVHTEDVTDRVRAREELRRYKDHLEEHIEERTAELQRVNDRLSREIAERKRAETELRENEERYRAIVEDQTELIARFEPDTTLIFVNGASCRYLNTSRDELIGKRFIDMISEENRELVKNKLRSLTREQPVSTHDQRTVLLNGEVRWQQWTNRAFFDDAGRLVGYQAVGRDITQRKEVEQALEQSNCELGVLNEINNIINSTEDSMTILSKMLTTISEHCGARYAGLFEVDQKHREMRMVASYGLPDEVRERVGRIDLGAASIQEILGSSGVVVAEEDIQDIPPDEFDRLKDSLGLKRVVAFVSRSGERVNFLAFLGRTQDEDVGDEIRNFLVVVGNQLGIALDRLRLITALEKSSEQLKKLSASLMETIEEERRRMALQLHDDMGQSLVALNVDFDLLERRIREDNPVDEDMLKRIHTQLRGLTESTRRVSYSLHPPALENFGLVPVLKQYVERFIIRKGLDVDFEASGFDEKCPRRIGLTLYRVAQEALTNIIRHADASHVVVQLTKGYPRVIMNINDNGKGFAPEGEPRKEGLGIVGMRERVERLGGDIRIITRPGAGTRIRVTLPLEVENAG